MGEIGELLKGTFEKRLNQLAARVTSTPLDANGRSLGYVLAEIGSQTGVKVFIGPSDVYYPGDWLNVEERGGAASAKYVVTDYTPGVRPASGSYEFTGDTDIGGVTYGAGDLLWGQPGEAHFVFDYSAGQLNLLVGEELTGRIDAGAGAFVAGNPEGLHGVFTKDGIEFFNGEELLTGWDAVGRTIFGVETLGRPHGPGIQQREFVDQDTDETRYAWQILGLNGVPGVAFITGSESDPNDYRFFIGPEGATNRLTYEDGGLSLTGDINAQTGTLGDLTVTGTLTLATPAGAAGIGVMDAGDSGGAITWANGSNSLDSNGITLKGDELALETRYALSWKRSDDSLDTSIYAIEGMADSYLFVSVSPRDFGTSNRHAWMSIESEGSSGKTGYVTISAMGNASDSNPAVMMLSSDGTTPLIRTVGDITLDSANALCLGEPDTNGSWRMVRNGNDLEFQRRESDSWVAKQVISA